MKNLAVFLVAMNFGLSAYSAAAIGENLLTCAPMGTFLAQCELQKLNIAPKQPYEMEFTTTYTFPCSGPKMGFLVQTGMEAAEDSTTVQSVRLDYAATPVAVKSVGFGPVTIADESPSKTSARPFSKTCQFIVSSIEVSLSEVAASALESDVQSIEEFSRLLTSAKDIENLSTSLKIIISKVDLDSIQSLIKDTYDKLVKLESSYSKPRATKLTEGQAAIMDAIDVFENALCENASFNSAYPEICDKASPVASNPPVSASESTAIADSFDKILSATEKIRKEASTTLAAKMADALAKAQYLKTEEKSKTTNRICSAGQAHGVSAESCPIN